MNDLQKEWAIIHSSIEKYERFSLLIKLFSILLSLLAIVYHLNVWFAVVFILVLWLQDGIWTTFQKRLEARIMYVEEIMQKKSDAGEQAFQLYSQWSETRQGIIAVIKEYILNSAKPTVAYPYIVLVFLMMLAYWYII